MLLLVPFDVKRQVTHVQLSLRSVGIDVVPSKGEAAGARPAHHAFDTPSPFA
jgi:hypothetical protein